MAASELHKTLNPTEVGTRVILEVMAEAENGSHTPGGLTDYESSETEWCQWQQRMLCVLSLLNWESEQGA